MPNGSIAVKAHETNIEKIVQLAAEQQKHVSPANRLSEAIGRFAGTKAFIVLQLAIVALWIVLNSRALLRGFDPYSLCVIAAPLDA